MFIVIKDRNMIQSEIVRSEKSWYFIDMVLVKLKIYHAMYLKS